MSETRRVGAFEITIPSLALRITADPDIADIPGGRSRLPWSCPRRLRRTLPAGRSARRPAVGGARPPRQPRRPPWLLSTTSSLREDYGWSTWMGLPLLLL